MLAGSANAMAGLFYSLPILLQHLPTRRTPMRDQMIFLIQAFRGESSYSTTTIGVGTIPWISCQRGTGCAGLYENRTYGRLVDRYGLENTYILSAGWGLIAAGFLTPAFDITFGGQADKYKRRRKTDRYDDLCMLPGDTLGPIVFFGGKDYVPLFCSLTESAKVQRFLFYNSAHAPVAPDCTLMRFNATTRTNWHYECANAVIDGKITI